MTPAEQLKEDRKLILRLDQHAVGLTSWEVDFVATCLERVAVSNQPLSDKQRGIANKLDDEKVK